MAATTEASTSTAEGSSSPKIQFKEPSFEGNEHGNRRLSGGSSNGNRRLSTGSSRSTGSRAVEDDHYQDWSTVTAEKDSWANRERRRSSLFHKIDSYPGPSSVLKPSSPTTSERRGSILSLWSGGKDKQGKDVLYSGDGPVESWEEDGAPLTKTISGRTRRVRQPEERRGSVLSIWGKGKDANGRDIILSE